MTITPGQMRAAGRELRLRREGAATSSDRPFGEASVKTLRRLASGPTPSEIAGMERELQLRDAGQANRRENRGPQTDRPFEQAQTRTLRQHVKRAADR